jgi:hypothetical protein
VSEEASGLVVEIVQGNGKQPWRVKLYSTNGKQLNMSEGYVSKWNAKRAARRMFPGVEPIIRPRQQ